MKTNQDIEHLQLLSIFHYVVAGAGALFSMFPVIHLIIGIAMVSGALNNMEKGAEPPPEAFGWIFIIPAIVFITCGLAISVCVAIAGRRLKKQTSHTYCLVIAAFECLFMPFGTVLGVFTIIVLMRPTVKELFGVANDTKSTSAQNSDFKQF